MSELSGLLLDTYEIRGILGRGNMGVVYHGYDRSLGREVAIKCPKDELLRYPDEIARFRSEAIAAGRISSPHVTTIFRVADYDDRPLIVMEVVRGPSLRRILEDKGPMSASEAMDIGAQVADALAAAHAQKIIHRDIKPANIVLTEGGQVKVMDFGIARPVDASTPGPAEGTAGYMAPEQASGTSDARSDLYSLGVVLYELTSGRLPFDAESSEGLLVRKLSETPLPPSRWGADLPLPFEKLILQLIEPDPKNRPINANTVAAALREMRATTTSRPRRRPVPRPRVEDDDVQPSLWRAAERDHLHELLERVSLGKGATVLLHGVSGSGKSRLVEDLVQHAAGRKVNVVRAACLSPDPATRALPLRKALGDDVPDDPGAIERAVIARAELGPVLVLVDDAQWIDAASAIAVRLLASATVTRPVLLAVCVDTDRGSRMPAIVREMVRAVRDRVQAVEITLAPLTPADTLHHVRSLLGERIISDDVSARITSWSAGVPGVAVAAIRALQESGALLAEGDRWVLRAPIDDDALPPAVAAFADRRLDVLSRDERFVLECAAVAGHTFVPGLVAAVAGGDPLGVLRTLQDVERETGLLQSSAETCTFNTPVVAFRLRQALSPAVRRAMHARIATMIESGAEVAGDREAALAHHYYAAGDHTRALPHLRAAGNAAVDLFEYEFALRSYERALDCIERLGTSDGTGNEVIELRHDLGRVCFTLGRPADAARHFETARDLCAAYGDRAGTARFDKLLGDVEFSRKNWDAALEDYARADKTFVALGDKQGQGDVCRSMGNIHFEKGEFDAVRSYYARTLAIGEEAGDDLLVARACNNLGAVSNVLGERHKALEYYHRSLEHYRRADDRFGQTQTVHNIGLTYAALQNWPEAVSFYKRSVTMAEEMQDPELMAISRLALAEAEARQGHLDAADEDCERALATFVSRHDRLGAADSYRVRGLIASKAGRAKDAERAFNECLAIAGEVEGRLQTAECQRDYADHMLSTGEFDDAEVMLDVARATFEELSACEHVAEVDRLLDMVAHRRKEAA